MMDPRALPNRASQCRPAGQPRALPGPLVLCLAGLLCLLIGILLALGV
jgi:hypothetical protein